MSDSRVLVTGVSGHWGRKVAHALAGKPGVTVIGMDTHEPEGLTGIEFVEADIRNPVVARLLPKIAPTKVVHCGIAWYPGPEQPARALHDINVIGTLQLLAACERTPSLEAVVVRGSSAIYGSHPAAPGFFTEDMARRFSLDTRFQRDIGELEGYFESFARRRPEVVCSMLRFQAEVGANIDQPLVRYLTLPVVPVQLGYDPMLQFLHPDDATGALAAAVMNPVRGPVNVAPDGAVSLSRTIRLMGRLSLPLPRIVAERALAGPGKAFFKAADMYFDGLRLLRYGRGCDNTRLKEEVGFRPSFDAEGVIRELREGVGDE